jgi:hypothetical protein
MRVRSESSDRAFFDRCADAIEYGIQLATVYLERPEESQE